jgi:hypothetical protein
MKKYYRIVEDDFAGYQVEVWRWWFPFWVQCWGQGDVCNTHASVAEAEQFARNHTNKFVIKSITIG